MASMNTKPRSERRARHGARQPGHLQGLLWVIAIVIIIVIVIVIVVGRYAPIGLQKSLTRCRPSPSPTANIYMEVSWQSAMHSNRVACSRSVEEDEVSIRKVWACLSFRAADSMSLRSGMLSGGSKGGGCQRGGFSE